MIQCKNQFIHLPQRDSREEYQWMVEFMESLNDENLKEKLEIALDGRGAFRRFKDVLLDYPKEREKWFKFRDEKIKKAVLEWCKENGIDYEEETK